MVAISYKIHLKTNLWKTEAKLSKKGSFKKEVGRF